MQLEVREVSRKTPCDGRLEIGETTARRLAGLGDLVVEVGLQRAAATLESVACQCGKGGGASEHVHHFVQAPLFTALVPGETVVLELLDGGVVSVARTHPLRPA